MLSKSKDPCSSSLLDRQAWYSEALIRVLIARAVAEFPDLTANGFDEKIPAAHTDWKPREVATALAFLELCEPTKRANWSSYELKHHAEKWGSHTNRASYVSNGSMIVAAFAMEFPIKRIVGYPNPLIGIRRSKSIDQILKILRAESVRPYAPKNL